MILSSEGLFVGQQDLSRFWNLAGVLRYARVHGGVVQPLKTSVNGIFYVGIFYVIAHFFYVP